MHNIFISYHHSNDRWYKEELLRQFKDRVFIDGSVDTGDIDENLPDETIREKIRDGYLKSTTVTILLVGTETKNRKHIDWELYSSMYNGAVNKQSGILVINLPSTNCTTYTAAHGDQEKSIVYPDNTNWCSVTTKADYEQRYPYMPQRIIDNLLELKAKISVTTWDRIITSPNNLNLLINLTFENRHHNNYDLSSPMKRRNS